MAHGTGPLTDRRPNILLIVTDQQSAFMLGCAGNRHVRTPAMDRIAARGVRFARTWCSNPMCLPSRFSLVTGRLGSDFGIRHNDDGQRADIPAAVRGATAGWLLRRAGYETAWGGKAHLPAGWTPGALGFETITRDERDGLAAVCADFVGRKRQRPFFLMASFINPHDICFMAIRDYADDERRRQLARKNPDALRELDAALQLPPGMDREAFFAWHCPPLPTNFEIQQDEPEAIRLMQARSPFKRMAREQYDEERWRLHRWAYARLTERVDGQVGRILDALEAGGVADNTLVIFTSDHGDMDASHRMEHKSAFYEEATRVPLLIAGAGVERRGAVDSRPVSNGLDLLPTLCDFAGAEPASALPGLSLRPLLAGQDAVAWRDLLPVESELGRMVTGGRYKYMHYDEGAHGEQLIDLLADPDEMRNAAADPQNREVLARMRVSLEEVFAG